MDGFRTYTLTLVLISVAASLVIILAPQKHDLIRYVRWITSLCITATMLLPLTSIGRDVGFELQFGQNHIPNELDTIDTTNELISNALKEEIIKNIKLLINNKFNVNVRNCSVEIDSKEVDNIVVDRIEFSLDTNNKFICSDAVKYIKGVFECDSVIIGG